MSIKTEGAIMSDKETLAQWMMQRGYATGHGDTMEDLLEELDWQILENWNRAMMNGIEGEREACALAAEAVVPRHTECGNKIAAAIRARGQG